MAANKKGFNKYKICGNATIIYIKQRNGTIHECLIDTEDLDLLIKLDYSWHVCYAKSTGTYYVSTTIYEGKDINNIFKYKIKYLTYYVMGMPKDVYIDHDNHDSLDNRKGNLRITSMLENGKNRRTKNYNNTSGYRNVSHNSKGEWVVQMQVNGKNTILKNFPTDKLDEAGAYAELMRPIYYGEFAGNN